MAGAEHCADRVDVMLLLRVLLFALGFRRFARANPDWVDGPKAAATVNELAEELGREYDAIRREGSFAMGGIVPRDSATVWAHAGDQIIPLRDLPR